MDNFAEYLAQIDNPQQRSRMEEVLAWVARKFPNLETKIAWNQPMFTDHGTFIIGFSTARHNLAIAPEVAGVEHFADEIWVFNIPISVTSLFILSCCFLNFHMAPITAIALSGKR